MLQVLWRGHKGTQDDNVPGLRVPWSLDKAWTILLFCPPSLKIALSMSEGQITAFTSVLPFGEFRKFMRKWYVRSKFLLKVNFPEKMKLIVLLINFPETKHSGELHSPYGSMGFCGVFSWKWLWSYLKASLGCEFWVHGSIERKSLRKQAFDLFFVA